MIGKNRVLLLAILFLFGLTACSNLPINYTTPIVTLTSFTPISTGSLSPQFEIRLHVVNPNDMALRLQGITYTVDVQGNRLMTGVANQIPVIDAYGEGDITLTAATSLLAGIRVISNLVRAQSDAIDYSFEARLDPGGLWPDFRIRENGTFSFSGN